MNIFFSPNVTIRTVSRVKKINRYGRPTGLVVVYHGIRGRIERKTIRVRNVSGDSTTIDGRLHLDREYELITGDEVKLMDGSEWAVFNIDEGVDAEQGRVEFVVYGLIKKREKDSA